MRVALIHPFFRCLGGSEHFMAALADLFPQADIFTLFEAPEYVPDACKKHRMVRSFLQNVPGIQRIHPFLMPLFPMAVESLDLRGYDLVISSDFSVAKGVITQQETIHICYCHTTTRYLWDYYFQSAAKLRWIQKVGFMWASHYARIWDFQAAQRVDHFLANSHYIAARIEKYYRRSSTVLYSPVSVEEGYLSNEIDDYYLSVGRLTDSKRVDLLIGACNRLGRRLKIVGVGPEMDELRALAGPTVELLGRVSDAELKPLYARCRGFLFAADEDFGLVPLEAQSYGRPVIAYGHGGSLETVRASAADGEEATGIHFAEQTVDSMTEAILRFEASEGTLKPESIREHALRFNHATFRRNFLQYVSEAFAARDARAKTAYGEN